MKNRYGINKYQVCTTPAMEVIYESKNIKAAISWAEKDGRWAYGYYFEMSGTAAGCFTASSLPAFNEYRESFSSKQAARVKAIEVGLNEFKSSRAPGSTAEVIKALKNARTPQLALF